MAIGKPKRLDLMNDIDYLGIKSSPDMLNEEDFSKISEYAKQNDIITKFYDNINFLLPTEKFSGIAVADCSKELSEGFYYTALPKGTYIINQFPFLQDEDLTAEVKRAKDDIANYLDLIDLKSNLDNVYLRKIIEPHGNSYQLLVRIGDLRKY